MVLVLFDFDGTISQSDTINALAQSAIAHSPNPHLLQSAWGGIVQAYLADYEKHVSAYSPKESDRTTVDAELSFLESLRAIEEASVERVEKARLFAGLEGGRMGDLAAWARETDQVMVREGFYEFVEEVVKKRGWKAEVVSVNWSGDWVGSLCRRWSGHEELWGQRMMVNTVGCPEGMIEGPVGMGRLVTAGDKLDAASFVKRRDGEEAWVYFGDSVTDIACLLKASVGVIMAQDRNTTLLLALDRLGFDVPHAGDCWEAQRLIWARNFDEIVDNKILDRVKL
ncbi:HAD-like domain-containing protein [Lasiosphaeria hispida]|uniref:HAD-like domain-containing protein n=1 Tax=Lasiosphaeria hispida TaxID=260671 RepID=A0AAJ0MJS0_9PEZI|nr:HAD-like domain-containing protein [Lasiosphaeria hispida]